MFLTFKARKTWTYPINLFPKFPSPPFTQHQEEPEGPRVLLALDNVSILRVLSTYLKWQGVSVIIALNPEQTLQLALSHSIDLIVYSAFLSKEFHPLSLLTDIRERGGKMPFIAIVDAGFDSVQDFIQQGGSDIVKTPLNIGELQTKIENQLNKT